MLVTTYDVNAASDKTRDAMKDRCHEQGHQWENCCSIFFHVRQVCKWCGEDR